ncbi:MAG: hypothetical protein AAB540_01585, partial [Patescibacteria group bacterium]
EIGLRTKQHSTYLAGSLKQSLKTKEIDGLPALQTKAVRSPRQRTKIGYCLEVVQPATESKKPKIAESETSTAEIIQRLEEIHQALLLQLRTVNKGKKTMPIDDELERQEILDTIEDIREEVEQALAATCRCLGEDKKDIIKILLEASQQCEAIMPSAIAEKTGRSQEEISAIMDRLQFTLKRSPVINLAVRAQRDPQRSHSFGYYIGLKQESQKNPENPTLPASTLPLDKDQRQMFMSLVDRAVKQTRPKARLAIIIFEALKMARTEDKQITPEYCQYVAYEFFKETYQLRAFEGTLIEMQEIPEGKFGFRIERTGLKTWQVAPSTDQEILHPILGEIEEQAKIAAAKNPEELKKRLDAGLKNLNIEAQASVQAVFDVLTSVYTASQGLSLGEIAERSKVESEKKIDWILRRVGVVNEKMPTLLGFKVVSGGADRYSLELTDNYTPAEIKFSGHAAVCPIPIEKDTNFRRADFNKIMASPKNRGRRRMSERLRAALEILASHSEKGEAISAPYLVNKTSKNTETHNGRSQDLIRTIKNFLRRLEDGKMSLVPHKLHTWYLSIDEPATQKPTKSQRAKALQQVREAKEAAATARQQAKEARQQAKEAAATARQQAKEAKQQAKEAAATARQQARKSRQFREPQLLDIDEISIECPVERTNYRAEEREDDDERHPSLKGTPLMEFQEKIVDLATQLVAPETATLSSLRLLEEKINALDTGKQSIKIKAQQGYLERLRRATRVAEREIKTALSTIPPTEDETEREKMQETASIVPRYLTDQLYSV